MSDAVTWEDEVIALLTEIRDALKQGARPPSAGVPGVRSASGDVFKFGRSKGTPLASGSTADLRWYGEAIARSINEPSKAQWRANNERDLALINQLLAAQGQARVGGSGGGGQGSPSFGAPPPDDFGSPPPADEDIPF